MKAASLLALLILLSVSLLVSNAKSDIQSVRVIPHDPTTADSINIEVVCWYSDNCWHIEGATCERVGPAIFITVRATDSWEAGPPCSDMGIDSTFVVAIGSLPENQYAVQVVEFLESKRDIVPDTVPIAFLVGPQSAADDYYPGSIPGSFSLGQNYPNPFNTGTMIPYSVRRACSIELTICDPLGRTIRILARSSARPGEYIARWDGTDDSGSEVPSGVYFCRLTVGDESLSRKMLLLR